MIFAGESDGESNFLKKTTFATKPMKTLAKVESESGGESGESSMSKYLKSLKAKANVSPTPLGVAAARARLPPEIHDWMISQLKVL